jgi:hypothetical protein
MKNIDVFLSLSFAQALKMIISLSVGSWNAAREINMYCTLRLCVCVRILKLYIVIHVRCMQHRWQTPARRYEFNWHKLHVIATVQNMYEWPAVPHGTPNTICIECRRDESNGFPNFPRGLIVSRTIVSAVLYGTLDRSRSEYRSGADAAAARVTCSDYDDVCVLIVLLKLLFCVQERNLVLATLTTTKREIMALRRTKPCISDHLPCDHHDRHHDKLVIRHLWECDQRLCYIS